MNIGGPSIHVKNLTEALNGQRYQTKLVTGTISPDEGDMSYITRFDRNVRIIIPELQREIHVYKDMVALFKLMQIVCRFQPDIIHSHTSKAGTVSRIAAMVLQPFQQSKDRYHPYVSRECPLWIFLAE